MPGQSSVFAANSRVRSHPFKGITVADLVAHGITFFPALEKHSPITDELEIDPEIFLLPRVGAAGVGPCSQLQQVVSVSDDIHGCPLRSLSRTICRESVDGGEEREHRIIRQSVSVLIDERLSSIVRN